MTNHCHEEPQVSRKADALLEMAHSRRLECGIYIHQGQLCEHWHASGVSVHRDPTSQGQAEGR